MVSMFARLNYYFKKGGLKYAMHARRPMQGFAREILPQQE